MATEEALLMLNGTNTSSELVDYLLTSDLGPRYHSIEATVILLTIYSLVFISGTVGNVCTCIVIARNNNMQTTTNYYLFSLAISDLLTLLIALPPEAYSIWEAYPWRFGSVFCYMKAIFQEMTSYASVLTITAFSAERYVAICHPLKSHTLASLDRSVKIIVAIWFISLICALPYPLHTGLYYYTYLPHSNTTPIEESLTCSIRIEYFSRMTYIFQLYTFLFFVFPMTVIAVLYLLIGFTLRQSALQRVASQESGGDSGHSLPVTQSGKAVFRMLVAVVVAFFIAWAPFHAQRLLTIYNRDWTPLLLEIQSTLFYVSGVLYFVGSTVNPILYNLMSKRYRIAFIHTIFHCRRKRNLSLYHSGLHKSFTVSRQSIKQTKPFIRYTPSYGQDSVTYTPDVVRQGVTPTTDDDLTNLIKSDSTEVTNSCERAWSLHNNRTNSQSISDHYKCTPEGAPRTLNDNRKLLSENTCAESVC